MLARRSILALSRQVLACTRRVTPARSRNITTHAARSTTSTVPRYTRIVVGGAAVITASLTLQPRTVGHAFWGSSDKEKTTKNPLEDAIEKADALYDDNQVEALHDFLTEQARLYPDSADILWRLSRAAYDRARLGVNRKELIYEAVDTAKKAVELDDQNFAAHKWVGITLSSIGEFEGTKASIANAYVCKDHFTRATELNPRDPTSRHLLGVWAWEIAGIGWVSRQAAKALFGTPPSATYEEALEHFMEAEKLAPGFYSTNALYIAQCHEKLGNKDKAKEWAVTASQFPPKSIEDKETIERAKKLLASL